MADLLEGEQVETQEVVEAQEPAAQEAPETGTEKSEETLDIVAREIGKQRERDEAGRFAKKQGEAPVLEKTVVPGQEEPVAPVVQEPPKHNPFSAWKKEAQEKLSLLEPDVQQMIVEREGQFHRGIEQYKEEANFARTIKKAVAPHAEYMQQLGVTPDFALSHLVGVERQLRTGSAEQKAAMFQQMALDYGVDLGQIAQMPFDPNMFRLQQQVNILQAQLQTPQASQQTAEDGEIESTIDEFSRTHEHFEELRGDMALLLQEGKAANLDDAYVKAIRLNDGLFEKYQAKQLEESRRNEAMKANQAAKAAKAAAVSVKGAPTGITHSPTPATTEDAVRQAMKQHGL